MDKNLKTKLAIFGLILLSVFLTNYLVPVAMVILGHTAASYYEIQFYWQLVVSLIYSGYIAINYENGKQIKTEDNESNSFEDSTRN